MKKVVVDSRIPRPCAEQLSRLGYGLVSLPKFSSLQAPVSAHPDMLLFFAGSTLLCHEDYLTVAKNELSEIAECGYDIVTSSEEIDKSYPRDVLFNALRIGKRIYCRADSVSKLILDFAKRHGYEIRGVKQGYSKCSVCTLGDRAAITADPSLCRAMREDGVDVLLISSGDIVLNGYDTGFIGGCSGEDGERIYFSGNIFLHPDGKKIADFCNAHGKTAVSLSNEPLVDIGTMFFI